MYNDAIQQGSQDSNGAAKEGFPRVHMETDREGRKTTDTRPAEKPVRTIYIRL